MHMSMVATIVSTLVPVEVVPGSCVPAILPHNLIKDKQVDFIEKKSKGKALFILHVMIEMPSSHLMQSEIIIYGLVRKCVKFSPFS